MAQKPNTLSQSQMEGHNYVVQLEPPERNDERATYGVYDTRSRCVLTGFSAAPGEGEADRWREDAGERGHLGGGTALPYSGAAYFSSTSRSHPMHCGTGRSWPIFVLLDSRVKSIATLLSEIRHLPPPPHHCNGGME
jgi:hypothetical protein